MYTPEIKLGFLMIIVMFTVLAIDQEAFARESPNKKEQTPEPEITTETTSERICDVKCFIENLKNVALFAGGSSISLNSSYWIWKRFSKPQFMDEINNVGRTIENQKPSIRNKRIFASKMTHLLHSILECIVITLIITTHVII